MLACFLLAFVLTIFVGIGYFMVTEALTGKYILKSDTYDDYVYFEASFASQSFGEDGDYEYLYVTVDDEVSQTYHDYVLMLPKEVYNSPEIQDLIQETYNVDGQPTPVRIQGYVREPAEELRQLVQETYQYYYAGEYDLVEAEEYLGRAVIEYSPGDILGRLGWEDWIFFAVILVITILCLVEIVKLIRLQAKKNRKIERTKDLYESDPNYQQALEETQWPDAIFYQKGKCWITRNYLVSGQEGLEVIPIADIVELYGLDKTGYNLALFFSIGVWASYRVRHYLVVVTGSGLVHRLAQTGLAIQMHSEIVAELLKRNPNISLGRNGLYLNQLDQDLMSLKLPRVRGFYGTSEPWKGRTDESFIV